MTRTRPTPWSAVTVLRWLAGRVPTLDPIGVTSTALDFIRGISALVVVVSHVVPLFFVPEDAAPGTPAVKAFYFASRQGHAAVMVFFVLSGLLIAGSVVRDFASGRWRWREYLINRISRLMVPLVPALVIGAAWDQIGSRLFAGSMAYTGDVDRIVLGGAVAPRMGPGVALANLFFLQGVVAPPFGSNYPLWSLSYEFWYYLAFPCVVLAFVARGLARRAGWVAAAIAMAFALGPIPSLFPVWLLGLAVVALPRVASSRLARIGGLLVTAGLLVLALYHAHGAAAIGSDYLIAIAFAALLWVVGQPAGPMANAEVPRWWRFVSHRLARISFTLYLVHVPVLVFVQAWFRDRAWPRWPPDVPHLALGALLLSGVCAYAWGLAWVAEFRTPAVRAWLRRRAS